MHERYGLIMNRKNKIKEILGKVLYPEGFRYNKTESIELSCVFSRIGINKLGLDVMQQVSIQHTRWGGAFDLKLSPSLGILTPAYRLVQDFKGFNFVYQTDEEYINQLEYAAEIIVKYGFQFIETRSTFKNDKKSYINSIQMLVDHEKIAEEYMKKENIPEDLAIEEVRDLVYEKVRRYQKELENKEDDTTTGDYDAILNMYIKNESEEEDTFALNLGAYYGVMLHKYFGGYWSFLDTKNCRGKTRLHFTNARGKEVDLWLQSLINQAKRRKEDTLTILSSVFEEPSLLDIRVKMDQSEKERLTKEYGFEKTDILSEIDDSEYITKEDSIQVLVNRRKIAEDYMEKNHCKDLSIKEVEKFIYKKILEKKSQSVEELRAESYFVKLGAYYGVMLQRYFVGYWSYDDRKKNGNLYVNFANDSGKKIEYPPVKAILCAWLQQTEEESKRFLHVPFEKISKLEKKINIESQNNGYNQFKAYYKKLRREETRN